MNENKKLKSIRRYIVVTIACGIIGGIFGYGVAELKNNGLYISDELLLKTIPMIILIGNAIALVAIILVSTKLYFEVKHMIKIINDDEEFFMIASDKISRILSILGLGTCAGIIMIAMCVPIVSSESSAIEVGIISVSTVVLFVIFVGFQTIMSVKCVEYKKVLYPEKKGYVLDKTFEKDWFNSMDEAERICAGEASFYSYKIMSKLYPYAMSILILVCIFTPKSYIFVILTGCLWMVHVGAYMKKVTECENKKKENV